jgi:subtilase family serine protease
MKRLRTFPAWIASGALLAACGGGMPGMTQQPRTENGAASQQQAGPPGQRACPESSPDDARCGVIIIKTGVQPDQAGWRPSDVQAAYNLPSSSKGEGQIVAIVDAYDNPNVASDLAAYRSHFGLPPATFTKYNQKGEQGNYPKPNVGWGGEIDLDVEMVSAACPNCTIDLIEANSFYDLLTAEKEAVRLGARIVSNSWYCIRCWRGRIKSAFDAPGVVYLAIGGDNNYASYGPAKLDNVVSVGGTILAKRGSKYKEIVWPWTGGGCANGVTKPPWQHDPGCSSRTQNDVAAVAFGVAEYDSYGYGDWITAAGTSVSTPLIAGIYGLAGNASSQHAGKKFWTLTAEQRKKYLHAITEGSDGSCGGSYLCTAGTGQYGTYSGPTGWGTPNGIGAF